MSSRQKYVDSTVLDSKGAIHLASLLTKNNFIFLSIGLFHRAFVSTRPLVHKHVKMSVGKWILETTHPQKHVHIPEDQISFVSHCLVLSFPNYISFEIIEHFRLYN